MRWMMVSAAVFVASGCFYSEVEIPELCAVKRDAAFEMYGPPVPVAMSEDLPVDVRSALPDDPSQARGRVSRLTVVATGALQDFSFVERGALYLAPASVPDLKTNVLEYATAGGATGPQIQASGAEFDLAPLLRDGKMVANVELEGHLPEQPFSAHVEVCLEAWIRYEH